MQQQGEESGSHAIRLGVGQSPKMVVIVPKTMSAASEAAAFGVLRKGASVREDNASITYVVGMTEEMLASIESSDAGLVAMTHGSVVTREPIYVPISLQEEEPARPAAEIVLVPVPKAEVAASLARPAAKEIEINGRLRTASYQSIEKKDEILRMERKVMKREQMIDRMIQEIKERKERPEFSAPFDLGDDIEIAERTYLLTATEVDGIDYRMVFASCKFWRYDVAFGVWQGIEKEEMKRILMETWARHPRFTSKGVTSISVSDSKLNGILSCFKTKANSPLYFTGSSLFGVGMRNGLLTILKGKITLVEKHPDWRCRSYIDADYTGNDECPMWRKYLDEVMAPERSSDMDDEQYALALADAEKKKLLLAEFVGGCVLGNIWERQKCLVLYGTGGNGKSVFTSVISRLFDEGSVAALSPQEWKDRFRVTLLITARVNIVAELPERDITDGERFKAIVSGEKITAERKYEDAIEASVKAGHIFSCNALPHANDASSGFWRRFLLVTFNNRFDERSDRVIALDDRIVKSELAGVARWAMEGAIRLMQQDGFTIPTDTAEKTTEWRDASDVIKSFLIACADGFDPTKKDSLSWTSAADVYRLYSHWCKNNGHQAMSSTKFGVKMKGYAAFKKANTGTLYGMTIKSELRAILRPSN